MTKKKRGNISVTGMKIDGGKSGIVIGPSTPQHDVSILNSAISGHTGDGVSIGATDTKELATQLLTQFKSDISVELSISPHAADQPEEFYKVVETLLPKSTLSEYLGIGGNMASIGSFLLSVWKSL